MALTSDQLKALNHLTKTRFDIFLERAFIDLNPSINYSRNWHLDLLAYTLARTLPEDCEANPTPDDRITRLIINVPPRSLKSFTTSSALPAFILGHFPHEKVIAASFSSKVAKPLSADTARIIRLPWYSQIFPHTNVQREREDLITTSQGGQRFTTSVGGTVTGVGGNYLIADDIMNPQEAHSDTERENANEWFRSTFTSRLNDRSSGVIIVIMQRLHAFDTTGMLLEANQHAAPEHRWHQLCLPAYNTDAAPTTYSYYDQEHIWGPQELLHPERLSQSELGRLQNDMGTYAFTGQYLQDPAPQGGGIVHLDWYPRFTTPPPKDSITRVIQSWDTSFKDTATSDYSVGQTWAETEFGYYLLHTFREKLEYSDLKQAIVNYYQSHQQRLPDVPQPTAVLIEDKASGQSLIQDFRRSTPGQPLLPVIAITPTKDKALRFAAVSPIIESGKVFLPTLSHLNKHWMQPLELEILQFPKGQHDDTVDAQSQALTWLNASQFRQPRIRVL